MHEVLGHLGAEVTADGSRWRFCWVGCTHHRANDRVGVVWTFEDHRNNWATAHERLEVWVEALLDVLFVVLVEGVAVGDAHVGGNDLESLVLETANDSAHEASFNGVRLTDNESAVHGNGVYAPSSLSPMSPCVRSRSLAG